MKTPTRNQLAEVFNNDMRLIIAVESLFQEVAATLTGDEQAVVLGNIENQLESVQGRQEEVLKALNMVLTEPELVEQISPDIIEQISAFSDKLAQIENDIQSINLKPEAANPHLRHAPYGEFYDTTSQTAAAINTAYPITFNTTAYTDGVELGATTSRVYVLHEGFYNFLVTVELTKAAAAAGNVWIWTRINGVDQTYSAKRITLSGSNADVTQTFNDIYHMADNDYLEVVWATDDTNCQLLAEAATAFGPAVPSISLTVVDNIKALQY